MTDCEELAEDRENNLCDRCKKEAKLHHTAEGELCRECIDDISFN